MDGPWGGLRLGVLVSTGTAVAGAVLLAGCSYTDEGEKPEAPLRIEPAPTEVGPSLDLDVPLDPSGFFEFNRWPPACDLLTDDEITTVLPQATVARQQAADQEFRFIETVTTVTVADAACSYMLDIPEAGLDLPEATMIRVSVEAAGSSEVVELNASPRPDSIRIEVPEGECWGREASDSVECRKGPLAFRVFSILDLQQQGDQWTNRYEVDGEVTTFTGDYGGEARSEAGNEEAEFLRDVLSAELAKIILAKI